MKKRRRIFVINLPERTDRRRQTISELRRAQFPEVVFYPAIRPSDFFPFGSLGERGCFLSHKAVLEAARDSEEVLVLEDDVSFQVPYASICERLDQLPSSWEFFYGGYLGEIAEHSLTTRENGVIQIASDAELIGAHCYAVNGPAIPKLLSALEIFLSRPRGHPEGGPMPIDGAFNVARRQMGLETFALTPSAAYQRSSRTDIGSLKWFDRTPVIKQLASALRGIKRKLLPKL